MLELNCFFASGTGRCGTMLLARLLNLGTNASCAHEQSIRYDKLANAWLNGDHSPLYEEISGVIEPEVEAANNRGKMWGEVSGLMYFAFPELYRRYGKRVRFLLLVRKPDEFVRSAFARGFFNPQHPHGLEHARPPMASAAGHVWDKLDPVEKNLWYWGAVNTHVINFFDTLDKKSWLIVRLEDLCPDRVETIYQHLAISGFNEKKVVQALSRPTNVSPQHPDSPGTNGAHSDNSVNPWSEEKKIPPLNRWPERWIRAYNKWAAPLAAKLYPELT